MACECYCKHCNHISYGHPFRHPFESKTPQQCKLCSAKLLNPTLYENKIETSHMLIEHPDFVGDFCGKVVKSLNEVSDKPHFILYFTGDCNTLDLKQFKYLTVYVIQELSENIQDIHDVVTVGQVPLNVHGMGVFFPRFFNEEYFDVLQEQHTFQPLTESNKCDMAYRKGLYISHVYENGKKFSLLRCSTNFEGPTEQFQEADIEILKQVNRIANLMYTRPIRLNHVLAQLYINTGPKKARIKSHADKTKDMPKDAVFAFCTFYDTSAQNKGKNIIQHGYDRCYKNHSMTIFTKLRFKLKETARSACASNDLMKQFELVLYPNSLFLMNLHTNRLYTHEIIPSSCEVQHVPTRIGYVIRCSHTDAIYCEEDQKVYVQGNELKMADSKEREYIKSLYMDENTSHYVIDYPGLFFTLNQGDLIKPVVYNPMD